MRSLGIVDAKPVVAPGVKQFRETAGEVEMDEVQDASEVISGLMSIQRQHKSGYKTKFDLDEDVAYVEPYSTIYGTHPRRLAATRHGRFKIVSIEADPFTGKRPSVILALAKSGS